MSTQQKGQVGLAVRSDAYSLLIHLTKHISQLWWWQVDSRTKAVSSLQQSRQMTGAAPLLINDGVDEGVLLLWFVGTDEAIVIDMVAYLSIWGVGGVWIL